MPDAIQIVEVDRIDGTSIIVEFSDGTAKEIALEELLTIPGKPQTALDVERDPPL